MPEQDPLSQLRDIHLPEAISNWPPAPGWWLLILILLVLVTFAIAQLYAYYHRNRYRRLAIVALKNLDQFKQENDSRSYVQKLNSLLKQTVLAANSGAQVAGLSGKQWLAFLDRSANIDGFSDGVGQALLCGPYQPHAQAVDFDELETLSRQWIKRHRLPC